MIVAHKIAARAFGGASGGVFRGMAMLALGSGLGRVVGIAAMPVLTRLYGPEDFGVLAVFTALVALVAPLVTLRYVLALPLPRHDGVAANLLALSAGLMLGLTVLAAGLLWIGGERLLRLVSMEVLAPWWWLIALAVLGSATYEMLTMWATRQRAYGIIARTSVTQSVGGAALKIGLGLLAVKPMGLLVGQVVAQAGGTGTLLRAFGAAFRDSRRHLRWSRLRKVAWRYRGFALWRVPSQFLLVFATQAPMLFFAALYDAHTTGQIGIALTALMLPLNILGQSTGKALYGEAAQVYHRSPSEVVTMARQVQLRLLGIAIVPAAVVFLFGERIFVLFFGQGWELAGQFASLLSVAMVFQFTSAPLMQLINLTDRQSLFLKVNAVRFAGLLCLFGLARALTLAPLHFILIYSVFMAVFYIAISVVVMRAVVAGPRR